MLQLNMKNVETQHFMHKGSRLIIVVVQFGAGENICSSSGGARKDRMKLSLPPKIDGFLSYIPLRNANILFLQVFF